MDLGWNPRAPAPTLALPLLHLRCVKPNAVTGEAGVCVDGVGDGRGRGSLSMPAAKRVGIMVVVNVMEKHRKGEGLNSFSQILKTTPINT